MVGVVGNIRHKGLDKDVTPQVYVPFLQFAEGSMMLVIHTSTDPLTLASAVTNEIHSIDREAPVYEVQTMDNRLSTSVLPRRFNLILLAAFAILAWRWPQSVCTA